MKPDPAPPASATDDTGLVQAFLCHLATEQGASPHTLSNYRRDIDKLLTAKPVPLLQLQVTHVRQLLKTLHAQGKDPRSLARYLAAWRRLFVFLQREHAVPVNPVAGLRPPRAARKLPEVLGVDAAVALVEQPHEGTVQEVRRVALAELLYSSGLRVAELCGLDVEDLRLASGELLVRHGKGGKQRLVPVGEPARDALQAWLVWRGRLVAASEPALFVGMRGQRISPRVVQLELKALARTAGVDTRVYPHLLRHSCASHVLQSSGDLRAVQELLGHASLAATQVYTHLDFQHLAQVYDATHPRARRRRGA